MIKPCCAQLKWPGALSLDSKPTPQQKRRFGPKASGARQIRGRLVQNSKFSGAVGLSPSSLAPWTRLALGAGAALAALCPGEAKALLVYNIYESGGNVLVKTSGSLDLTGASLSSTGSCGVDGGIYFPGQTICTGPGIYDGVSDRHQSYLISGGPFDWGPGQGNASSVSGITTILEAEQKFGISQTYISGTPIVSSATFNGTTLIGLGITRSSGVLGTYNLNGTSETIQVVLGAPAVPGPLPLFGAAAAFGWSRRLRRRVQMGADTLPRA